jgi:hypothetical protein
MNARLTNAAIAMGVLVLTCGCATTPPERQALDEKALEKVQAEIKQEVGVYLAAAKAKAPPGTRDDFWCGSGGIDFDIASVKAQLTSTVEITKNKGIKAKLPFKVIEVDLNGAVKTDVTNTQELNYTLWPIATDQQTGLTDTSLENAPIAKTLMDLRTAMITSALKTAPGPQACFTDYNPAKPGEDAGNTFKLGLSFINETTGGFEFTVWVLDVTDTTDTKGTTGNTLTVTFVQRGLKGIQILKDEADKQCTFPDFETPKCKIATRALHLITAPSSKVGSEQTALDNNVQQLCTPAKAGDPPSADCKRLLALANIAKAVVGTGVGVTDFVP